LLIFTLEGYDWGGSRALATAGIKGFLIISLCRRKTGLFSPVESSSWTLSSKVKTSAHELRPAALHIFSENSFFTRIKMIVKIKFFYVTGIK